MFNQQNDNKRLDQMTEEELKATALRYARADWHNVENTLKIAGIEYDEKKVKLSLFKYKHKLLTDKIGRGFGLNIDDV